MLTLVIGTIYDTFVVLWAHFFGMQQTGLFLTACIVSPLPYVIIFASLVVVLAHQLTRMEYMLYSQLLQISQAMGLSVNVVVLYEIVSQE